MVWHGRFSWCARRRNRFRRDDVWLDLRRQISGRGSRRRYHPFWLLFALKLDCRGHLDLCTAYTEADVRNGRAQRQSNYCPHSHAPLYEKRRTLSFWLGIVKCDESFQHRLQIQQPVQQYR